MVVQSLNKCFECLKRMRWVWRNLKCKIVFALLTFLKQWY